MGKKTNLKATLSSHQEKQRQAQLQKAREGAKKDVLKKSRGQPSAKAKGKRPQPNSSTIPFSASDTILLIGEGNFSFARALFTSIEYLPPANVTATTYDSEDECYAKYPDAQGIVGELRAKGVVVLFSVDARRLDTRKELKKKKWQRVVWNFPHAGKGITDQDRNVLSNQLLLLDFLKSVAPLLEDGAVPSPSSGPHKKRQRKEDDMEEDGGQHDDKEDSAQRVADIKQRGTVLVTLRNSAPYTLWDLPRLAKKPPPPHPSSCTPSVAHPQYVQLRSFAFRRDEWKGYEHRMTKGWVEGLGTGADKARDGGALGEDRMWEFYLAA